MPTMYPSAASLVTDRIPSQESLLSPEWTNAITTLMGHPLSSELGKHIQKWILNNAVPDPITFWLSWDPPDPNDIKLLQNYIDSNGSIVYQSIVYLPSNTVKNLISLWNFMNLLIRKAKSADQKCNVL